MKIVMFALLATSSLATAQGFEPTYPCHELSVSSSCAAFPYLAPAAEGDGAGTKITCELLGPDFSSVATQRQAPQLDCVYGQCTPAGYGLFWYLTDRTLSNPKAPRVLLSTEVFDKDVSSLDGQEVSVSFNAPQSFFDYAGVSSQRVAVLNGETTRLSSQSFRVSVASLLVGIERHISVGVLARDETVSYVDTALRCSAQH